MATLTSTLRLIEQTTAPIQHTIDAMNRMIDVMEMANRSADMPNLDTAFGEARVEISLASHALDEFNNELAQSDNHAAAVNRMSDSFHGFGSAVIVANQGLQLIRQVWEGLDRIGSSSDDRIGADARLSLINDGLRTQEMLEAQVMAVAGKTRTEYEATAGLVARIGRQDYFKGDNDLALAFAKTINEGLVVSGASASESASAITQLSQAIASGLLRGEEFNSIMDNGSVLAEMMSQSLGVTKGKLRELAEDGALTTDVVVSSIMQQAKTLEAQFNQMPVTYGQAMVLMHNRTGELLGALAEPGQAIDILITKIEELNAWLDTADGQLFFDGIVQGAASAVNGLAWLAETAGSTYLFFTENWSTIEPILWGLAIAVGGLTTAFAIYTGVAYVAALAEGIRSASQMIATGATIAEAAAQYGLNAALLACPITWIIGGIILAIAAIVAVAIAVRNMTAECEWFNEAAAVVVGSVGGLFGALFASLYNDVAFVWNTFATFAEFLNNLFIDPVYAVKKLFYDLASTTLGYIADMVSAIEGLVNLIPGVQINLTDGLNSLIGQIEEANAALTSDKNVAHIARMEYENVGAAAANEYQKGYDWTKSLYTGKSPAEESALQTVADSKLLKDSYFPPVEISGGKIDKVGGEVDISNQSLEYMNDLAEIQVLGSFSSYNTMAYEQEDELKLDPRDANAMRESANSNINIYYLNYSGGVQVKNDINKGMNLDEIKQSLYDESQAELETGISFVEEAVNG